MKIAKWVREEKVCVIVGQELRRARISAGMTQDTLAAKIGRTKSFISDLERGTRNASLETINCLHAVFTPEPRN